MDGGVWFSIGILFVKYIAHFSYFQFAIILCALYLRAFCSDLFSMLNYHFILVPDLTAQWKQENITKLYQTPVLNTIISESVHSPQKLSTIHSGRYCDIYMERMVFPKMFCLIRESFVRQKNFTEICALGVEMCNGFVDSVWREAREGFRRRCIPTHMKLFAWEFCAIRIQSRRASTIRSVRVVLFFGACENVELALIVTSALFDWCGTCFFRFFSLMR